MVNRDYADSARIASRRISATVLPLWAAKSDVNNFQRNVNLRWQQLDLDLTYNPP
jgi:hypothetical protein